MSMNEIPKAIGFYNGQVIAIHINSYHALAFMGDWLRELGIKGGKNAPAFGVFF